MSILIRGLDMPNSCESCPCKTADAFGGIGCQATGYIPLRKAKQDRPDNCPLFPVPPHGRLIDKDAIRKKCERGEYPNVYIDTKEIAAEFYAARTIIPAEEGET